MLSPYSFISSFLKKRGAFALCVLVTATAASPPNPVTSFARATGGPRRADGASLAPSSRLDVLEQDWKSILKRVEIIDADLLQSLLGEIPPIRIATLLHEIRRTNIFMETPRKTVLSWLETVRSGATRVDLEQVRRLSAFSKELVELLRLFALQDRDSFWMLCSVAGGGKPAFRVENRRNAFSARLRENTVLLSRFGIELHIANDFPFVLNRESTKSIFSNPSVIERMRAFFRDTGNARDVERLALDAPMNDSDLDRLLSFWKSLDRFDHRFTFIEGLILGFDLLSVDAFARAYRLEQPPSLPVSPRFVLFLLAGPALYERLSPFLSFKAFRHSFTGALEAGLRSVTGMNNVNRVMKRRFGFDLFRQNPLASPRAGLDRLADKSA